MISGCESGIGEAMNDCQMVALLSEHRKVFTQREIGCTGANWLEFTAVFGGRIRLHVPHIDVRRTAAEKKKNRRTGFSVQRSWLLPNNFSK